MARPSKDRLHRTLWVSRTADQALSRWATRHGCTLSDAYRQALSLGFAAMSRAGAAEITEGLDEEYEQATRR